MHLDSGIVYFGFHGGYNGNTGLRMMSASAATGDLDSFQPPTNGIRGVEDITSNGSLLAAVGDFTNSGRRPARTASRCSPSGSGGGTTTTSATTAPTTAPLDRAHHRAFDAADHSAFDAADDSASTPPT